MSSRDRFRKGCVVFVGNLPGDVRESEVEDLLYKFGTIRRIDLKTPPRPPAFAFVEFEDPRDAEDSVRHADLDFCGHRLRIELARGGGPPPAPPPSKSNYRGSPYRVIVKGLPRSASWQDLKDHFRRVVNPSFTNVYSERDKVYGVVEFDSAEDLKYAIRKLDDTQFRNPFDRTYIRLVDDSRDKSRSRSRSPQERRRKRSVSYSRSRSRSRSLSNGRAKKGKRSNASVSPDRNSFASKSKSKSKSRSKSRSPSNKEGRSLSASPVKEKSNSPITRSRSRSRSEVKSGGDEGQSNKVEEKEDSPMAENEAEEASKKMD